MSSPLCRLHIRAVSDLFLLLLYRQEKMQIIAQSTILPNRQSTLMSANLFLLCIKEKIKRF